jgi:hypothetical protein
VPEIYSDPIFAPANVLPWAGPLETGLRSELAEISGGLLLCRVLATRRLTVTLRRTSFPAGSRVGRRLRQCAGNLPIDVDYGLACIGLLTRPPLLRGFSLGDTWAWLRYRSAVANTAELRLREEWTAIDPHQKTILSDEVAVGLLCYFLARRIGFNYFGDTNYVANSVLPGIIQTRRPSRRGPAKSPDFIVVDRHGRVHVVECKGSQAAWRPLRRAMTKGRVQKGNVVVAAAVRGTSMVAGLFFPQWDSREQPRMHFIDPPQKRLFAQLEGVDPILLRMAVVQIFLAKHFALLGLAGTAARLSLTPLSALPALRLAEAADEAGGLSPSGEDIVREADHRSVDEQGHLIVSRFSVRYSRRELVAFSAAGAIFEHVRRLASAPANVKWTFSRDQRAVRILTPLGFTLEMSTSGQ